MNLAEELQKLQALREQGVLTDEEFTQAKKVALDSGANSAPMSGPQQARSALHQLRRSLTDRWLGGVCGGIAEITNVPSWAWRIVFILMLLAGGTGLLLYILLWIFVPSQTIELARPASVR